MFNIITLYKQQNSVFSFSQLAQLFPEETDIKLRKKLSYAVKTDKLGNPRKGIYVKEGYSVYELANKIYTPSYISLNSVLKDEGVIFQHDPTVTVISYVSREISCDKHKIKYHRIRDDIVVNKSGIKNVGTYFRAEVERALLDTMLLYKDFHFDNINAINLNKAADLLSIYNNKQLQKRFNSLVKEHD